MYSTLKIKYKACKHEVCIALIFFAINLLQAIFTPLINDESYYWVYAQHLQLGYFDHPPLIASLIYLGTNILPSEIGIRIFNLILGSLTIFLWLNLVKKETKTPINFKYAFLLLAGSLFINFYTFMALPDTPLLFAVTLFFWAFSKYLKHTSWKNIIILSLSVALLLYAKYHGILIVLFTFLANPTLLKKRTFYAVLFLSVLWYMPHLIWLIENDFQTIKFQLIERGSKQLNINNVLSYIVEQLVLTGPIFILLFSILYKSQNTFQRTLKINTIGVFIFFLISAFMQRINTHWTNVAWIPMLALCYMYLSSRHVKPYIKRVISD